MYRMTYSVAFFSTGILTFGMVLDLCPHIEHSTVKPSLKYPNFAEEPNIITNNVYRPPRLQHLGIIALLDSWIKYSCI